MDVKEGLELAEQLVGRTLKPLEIDIFEESWKGREGKKYREIAETYPCREGHVNDVASDLWKLLSKALGKKVIKSNFRRELEKRSRSHSAEVPQPQEQRKKKRYPRILILWGVRKRSLTSATLSATERKSSVSMPRAASAKQPSSSIL
jgi:hypothetical protein